MCACMCVKPSWLFQQCKSIFIVKNFSNFSNIIQHTKQTWRKYYGYLKRQKKHYINFNTDSWYKILSNIELFKISLTWWKVHKTNIEISYLGLNIKRIPVKIRNHTGIPVTIISSQYFAIGSYQQNKSIPEGL